MTSARVEVVTIERRRPWHRTGCKTEALPPPPLYLGGVPLLIRAKNGTRVGTYDLTSGRLAQVITETMVHTPVWRVEVPRVGGKYETLAEFGA